MTDYEKNAVELAEKYNIEKKILCKEFRKYFPSDKEERDVYTIRLSSPFSSYVFTFGDSIVYTNKNLNIGFNGRSIRTPSFYDIFSCTQKYEVSNDIDEFCQEFGYSADYGIKNLIKLHEAVKEEYKNFSSLFRNDVIPTDILEIC